MSSGYANPENLHRAFNFSTSYVPNGEVLSDVNNIPEVISSSIRMEGNAPIDVVLINGEKDTAKAERLVRQHRQAHVLPFIGVNSKLNYEVDANIVGNNHDSVKQMLNLIQNFAERRYSLPHYVLNSFDDEIRLLAYLYVSGKKLEPKYMPDNKECIGYSRRYPVINPEIIAEKLFAKGLMERNFFERIHICPTCDSARMNVREICNNCSSANIDEEAIVHHFRCAYSGPESDYRKNEDYINLICPKCHKELNHYGHEYDRSGYMYNCNCCGSVSAEPEVGFTCFDCNGSFISTKVNRKDIYSYDINSKAIDYLLNYLPEYLHNNKVFSIRGVLPLGLLSAIDKYKNTSDNYVLCEIRYSREKEIVANNGYSIFVEMRQLFCDNLKSAVAIGKVHSARDFDYALIPNTNKQGFVKAFSQYAPKLEKGIENNLGIDIKVFDRKDLS